MRNVVEALRDGRDKIAAGFCKHLPYRVNSDGQPQYCAVGAVGWHGGAVRALHPHLPEEWKNKALNHNWPTRDKYWDQVVAYNNDPATTQADMVALFEKALAEQGGLA